MWKKRSKYGAAVLWWLGAVLLLAAQRPTVALVLSGGGARGIAQVGVLKVLERYHIPIDVIAGTSIGAVIGGLYAAGYSALELDSILRTIRWEALFDLRSERERSNQFLDQREEEDRSILQLRFRHWKPVLPQAVSTGYRVAALFQQLVWNAPYHHRNFDSLRIPFRAVATDLVSGNMVILRQGDLARALQASATVPIQYTPVAMDSMLLVDGGLLANIPVVAVREFAPDIIIVVNTTSPLLSAEQLTTPWAIADQVVSVTMQQSMRAQIQQADFLIEPPLEHYGAMDFAAVDSLIAAGEQAAEARIEELLHLLKVRRSPSFASEGIADVPVTVPERGTLPRIREIVWVADQPVPEPLDVIACRFRGAPISEQTQQAMFLQTARWFRSQHLAFGKIHWVAVDTATGTILLDYSRGIIDTVLVTGNEAVPLAQIYRFLPFVVGTPFRSDLAIRAWKQLMNSGLFADVKVQAEADWQNKIRVLIQVRERATTVLRLGGMSDNERHTQLFLELAEENFLDQAHHLALWIGGGQRNFTAELRFRLSQLLVPWASLQIRLFYRWTHFFRYREHFEPRRWIHQRVGSEQFFRYGAKFRGYRRIGHDGVLFGEVRLEFLRQWFQEGNARRIIPYRPLLTGKVGLRYDSRNDVDFPDSGRVIQLSFESPLLIFPQGYQFSKAVFSYTQWIALTAQQQLQYEIFAGFGDRTLPRSEYFRLGGARLFPGLYESQWVGTQLLHGSVAWRMRLPLRILFDTYLECRIAASGVWQHPAAVQLRELGYAVGASLLWATPLGPASVTIGRGLRYRRGIYWTPIRLFFQIGKVL